MAQGEFVCHDHEEPEPGNPIHELPIHFERVWHLYTRLMTELMGWSGVARLLERDVDAGAPRPGEFEEDIVPTAGLPDLCTMYNLPALLCSDGSPEGPEEADAPESSGPDGPHEPPVGPDERDES